MPTPEPSVAVADGWYVVTAQWVGTSLDNIETVYSWDPSSRHASRTKAVSAGWEQHGHDDFNVGRVEAGALAWFGWMDEEHPPEDRAEVAQALGVPDTKDRPPLACEELKTSPRGSVAACQLHEGARR